MNMDTWSAPNQEYAPPKQGEPALHRAARLGDADAIRSQVAAGADVNASFDMGLDPGARSTMATPLMVAAGSGDGATVETLRLLVELGADPMKVLSNQSAATFAARGLGWNYRPGGDAARLQALLDAGAPIAGNSKLANRAIGDAAEQGDLERLKILVAAGCDVNGYDRSDDEPVRKTWADRLVGIIESKVVQKKFIKAGIFTADARTSPLYPFEIPLFMAAQSGNLESVAFLIEKGAQLDMRDQGGNTAMFEAGSKEVVDFFVQKGLSLEIPNRYGWTALTNAVCDGLDSLDLARWLIEAGADVNATHDRGYTVFMSAASSMERHVDFLKLLAESGADPNAVTDLGYNAFHAAIDVNGEANSEASIRSIFGYLSELGVDINLKNKTGQTPLDVAKQRGTEIEREILIELGAT